MALKLSGDTASPLVAAVTLVAKYCGVALTAESTADAAPTLHTPQGPLVGAVAACTFLAEGSKVAAQLLGSDDATKAQVSARSSIRASSAHASGRETYQQRGVPVHAFPSAAPVQRPRAHRTHAEARGGDGGGGRSPIGSPGPTRNC
jgi:hypothetical protein